MRAGPRAEALPRREAAAASLRYHFAPTDVAGVFARHVSVQLDPLAPLATSHDLTFAARVPNYRVGDGEAFVFRERGAFDGFDKQACWIRSDALPARRELQRYYGARWRSVVDDHPHETRALVAEIEERGPSEPSALAVDRRIDAWAGSWYGPRLAKRIARALWHAGTLATHHRRHGRHVYDLQERVHPAEVLRLPVPNTEDAYRTLIEDRHRAAGLLREGASGDTWSLPLAAGERRRIVRDLVAEGRILPLTVDGVRFHAVPEWIEALATPNDPDLSAGAEPRLRFVAPLDAMLWDREALRVLFDFHYRWEVYVPAAKRRYGWYVVPVVDADGVVARAELRREPHGEIVRLRLAGWWWEPAAEARYRSDPAWAASLHERTEAGAAALAYAVDAVAGVSNGSGAPRALAAAFRRGAERHAGVRVA